jgi:hypothetical protein
MLIESTTSEFEPFRPSEPFLRSGRLSKRRKNSREIPPFRAFGFVSAPRFAKHEAGNRRKSPTVFSRYSRFAETTGGNWFDRDFFRADNCKFSPNPN